MTPSDRREFAEVMTAVFEYYGKTFSDSVLEIYWTGLRQYDLAAIRDALGRHAKNPDSGQFMPKIADVEKMIEGSTMDSALAALAKLERAMSSLGAHFTVVFDDGLIHTVVEEMGGWIEVANSKAKDWQFRRTEFMNRYRGYRQRSQIPEYRAKLVGIIDGVNSSNGFEVGEENVRLIGDRDRATAVLASGSTAPRITMRLAMPSLLEKKP